MAAERHDYIIQELWLTYSPPLPPTRKKLTHTHSDLSTRALSGPLTLPLGRLDCSEAALALAQNPV